MCVRPTSMDTRLSTIPCAAATSADNIIAALHTTAATTATALRLHVRRESAALQPSHLGATPAYSVHPAHKAAPHVVHPCSAGVAGCRLQLPAAGVRYGMPT